MARKNLKAIVVSGTGKVVPASTKNTKSTKEVIDLCNESTFAREKSMGSAAAVDLGMMTGDVPIRNWREGEFERLRQHRRPGHDGGLSDKRTRLLGVPMHAKRVVQGR